MPRMDQTGPLGQGPRTGRGMGRCAGLGMGYGYGLGRTFFSPKNQLRALEEQEQMLVEELETIREEKRALEGEK